MSLAPTAGVEVEGSSTGTPSARGAPGLVQVLPLARPGALAWLGPLVFIALVQITLRVWLALTPDLSETYYDEALTGLMSLHILRGGPQVFYWGQPYLGAVDAYLVAAGFWLFGSSTFVLRLVVASTAVGWAWAAWSLARRIAGEPFGLLAGLYLAVPPVFLAYIQLSSHGETVSLTLGTLLLAVAAALLDDRVGARGRQVAWVLLGLTGGLGWWTSQMMGMFLLAAAVVLVVARPRVIREPGPYVALGVFFVASAPFWIWNARHEWATFWHLATWGAPLPRGFLTRLGDVVGPLLATFHDYFWDGRAVRLPPAVDWLWPFVLWTFYVPAVVLATTRAGVWAQRLLRRTRPWQEPLDLVVLAFWGTVAAHLLTWFGTSTVLRYSMTFYATVPVLGMVALARVARAGRVWCVVALAAAVVVLAYNGVTNAWFVRQAAAVPFRPVDRAIQKLEALGVRACYADSRIAQVLAFESRERIECADYYGLRNYAFLQAVDAVDDPATVAIVTHRVLRSPGPETMAQMLHLIGGRAQVAKVGDYVIYHHIAAPDSRIQPIPHAGWRADASTQADRAPRAFDRKVWTWWTVPKREGEWFLLDLGRSHPLAQLVLATAPDTADAPVGLLVETSQDGHTWERAVRITDLMPGVHWWKGHPRVDESGQVLIRMAPRPARYVRLTHLGSGLPGSEWSIGELFVYETAAAPWTPPPAAQADVDEARRELAHFMDDPGGPNPRRAPVTYPHRRAQVAWSRVFAAADQALQTAPEWAEAHHLYGFALAVSGWTVDPDDMVERARADQAWPEVVRWADLADVEQSSFWRSGRNVARAEARARLGQVSAAIAPDAAEPRPAPAVAVRFGRELELTGAALPLVVRSGETVTVRYDWRALSRMRQDYWAFVHVHGEHRWINEDHVLGVVTFGTSRWSPGEEVRESLALTVPPGTPPGSYRVKIGVWFPSTGKRLRVTAADRPQSPHDVELGTLTVVPPGDAERSVPAPRG